MYPLYPRQIINSVNPCNEYVLSKCHRIGRPPISTKTFGLDMVSSDKREPRPPAKITVFILDTLAYPLSNSIDSDKVMNGIFIRLNNHNTDI